MSDLLSQSQALRAVFRAEVPSGAALDEALAAFDHLDAVARLMSITDEKATVQALAGKDPDAMRPVEKAAWIALAKAQAVAADEEAAIAAKAMAEAEAAAKTEAALAEAPAVPVKP